MSMNEVNPAVKSMSIKDMDRVIFDILTDNGMSEELAENTVNNMSLRDMENYLSNVYNVGK